MENNHVPVTRLWLESLSTDELIKLADTYGIDIPPGLERIFVIEELLEAANMDRQQPAEDIGVNPSYSETVLLPKQYNISFIDVIIRDPLWAFVFWEIKGHDREIHENALDFNGYCLRVIPLDEDGKEPKQKENSFALTVGADDNARYIGFAEDTSRDVSVHGPCGYIIKLGVIRGGSERTIVSSAPFYLPKLGENEIIADISRNNLIRLSGAQDLIITKNTDRQPRVKRQ